MALKALQASVVLLLQSGTCGLCYSRSHSTSRRNVLRDVAFAGSGLLNSFITESSLAETPTVTLETQQQGDDLQLPEPLKLTENRSSLDSTPFFVQADSSASLAPKLVGVSSQSAIDYISAPPVQSVWLGEHHNSLRDHELQISILQDLYRRWVDSENRPLVVGLEAIQQRFQPVLDDYIAGNVDDETLFRETEWQTRWFWPFDRYLPVFRFCRDKKIPLMALSVDSESLERCEMGGLQHLTQQELKQYLPDANGFNSFTNTTAFREYIAYNIKSSYELHEDMGLLNKTVSGTLLEKPISFSNFYASRILRDEAMATAAARWVRKFPEGRFIGLVGSNHVKFSCGVPARTARLLQQPTESAQSIMLNPTAIDTSRTASDIVFDDASQIVLQIRFAAIAGRQNDPEVLRSVAGGDAAADVQQAIAMKQVKQNNKGVLPVADFFWFSPGYKEVNGFQNNNYLM